MDNWLAATATIGIGALSVGGTILVSWLRKKAIQWHKHINNPIIESMSHQLDIWIDDSINTVNKSFVDKIKEQGTWDKLHGVFDKDVYKDNSSEALSRCLQSLMSRIPIPFKRMVEKYYDDAESFYKSRIDERLKEHELDKARLYRGSPHY